MSRFELAWVGYQNHAKETGNPDAEERLYANLANLALVVGNASVKQPPSLASSLDELMAAAEMYNSKMHGAVRHIIEGFNGAVYEEGPLKLKERVEEKVRMRGFVLKF